jgi:hypothetical protein
LYDIVKLYKRAEFIKISYKPEPVGPDVKMQVPLSHNDDEAEIIRRVFTDIRCRGQACLTPTCHECLKYLLLKAVNPNIPASIILAR